MIQLENIRRNKISEIKKKVMNNPKYLHPCNKERLNDMKKLIFSSGNEFTQWMQQNGIMKNPTDIEREQHKRTLDNSGCKTIKEYNDKRAQKLGYKDRAEYIREWQWNTGICGPMSENEDCESYFGVYIGENYISKLFENPIRMPPNNPGFDWICKNGKKIQCEARCLHYIDGVFGWSFTIDYNNMADYFILSGWNNRESLEPIHIWMIHKNDEIRGDIFWRRGGFWITNTSKKLKEFEKYELSDKLDKLKEYCKNIKSY